MNINLLDFCGDEDSNFRIGSPFSKGEWSYATNGHVLIRVPLIAGLREDGPNAEKLFEVHCKNAVAPSINFAPELPPLEQKRADCSECDSTGLVHDCPSCDCECEDCAGEGDYSISSDKSVSVQVGGVWFACECIRLLLTLPALKIAPPIREKALRFTFDGGDGLLMPLRSARATNIVVAI